MSEIFVVNAGKRVQEVSVTSEDSSIFAIRIDDVSTTGITYVGKATVGSSPSSPVWQIQKLDESGTPVTTVITWAGGGSFNQIWDNRTSLTYG